MTYSPTALDNLCEHIGGPIPIRVFSKPFFEFVTHPAPTRVVPPGWADWNGRSDRRSGRCCSPGDGTDQLHWKGGKHVNKKYHETFGDQFFSGFISRAKPLELARNWVRIPYLNSSQQIDEAENIQTLHDAMNDGAVIKFNSWGYHWPSWASCQLQDGLYDLWVNTT